MITEPGVKRVIVLPTVILPLVGAEVSVGKALTGRVGLVDGQETMNGAARV